MKRSQMLEVVERNLRKIGCYAADNPKALREAANLLLTNMELNGMFAPPLDSGISHLNDEGLFFQLRYKFRPNPETGDHQSNWEPEDE